MEPARLPDQPDIRKPVEESTAGFEHLARREKDGSYSLSVMVRGVHCAACIQKIEGALSRDAHMRNARLNYSTARLSLQWDGKPEQANEYVRTVERLGFGVFPYNAEEEESTSKKEERFLLLCLGVAGFAMGNIMLLSVGLWTTSEETMGLATRDFLHWMSAAIALPAILFSGRPFFRSALKALSNARTNMDVPISLAIVLASGMSLLGTIHHSEHVYFDSAVMLIFFLLIGRYLDFRARKNARSTATDLLSALSGFANVVRGGKILRLPVRDLEENMIIRVMAGEKCPVDGIVTEGRSEMDTSLITGETIPQAIEPESHVYAGTMNMSAPVHIRVIKRAEDTLLADIIRLMEQAGQGQAQYVRIADRAAKLYTPVVHSLAALAFFGWLFVGQAIWQDALMIAITVLIITCPCALGLAVPVVQVLATGKLMKNGVLVKSGDALERLAGIDTVLLDKTGTLTIGRPALQGNYDPQDLKLAASLASHSTHPLSKALTSAYDGEFITLSDIQDHPGRGMEAVYNGKRIRLGSRIWCGEADAPQDELMELWLRAGDDQPVRFTFRDALRADTADTIAELKRLGLTPIMVTGDREAAAIYIAQRCGMDLYHAQQTPAGKYTILEELKARGHKVLMVGDGLNDAPVLAGADVSMAPGSAIDMAQNAADIIFMGDHLGPVAETYKTASFSQKLVKENFALAVLYNIIAIPLAFAGLVTPMIAALAMSGSSLVVIANSFRLKLKT